MKFLSRETTEPIISHVRGTVITLFQHCYYPTLKTISSSCGPEVEIEGRRYINFGSNSYLDISRHPKVLEAVEKALRRYGGGSGAARLTAGTYIPHRQLEERIAQFMGYEDAVLFSAGALVNMGVIPALMSPPLKRVMELFASPFAEVKEGVIFADAYTHASIIDGIIIASSRLFSGKVKFRFFSHLDMGELEKLLRSSKVERKLIVTDGVFSLHGHVAPLRKIVELMESYDAQIYLDDAHGIGVFGSRGRGVAEYFGVEGRLAFQMGTLSKAFGGAGGFIVGEKSLCDYLRVATRTYLFETAMPPEVAGGMVAAIDVVENESWRRESLWKNVKYLHQGLNRLGFDTLESISQIIPVLLGKVTKAKEVVSHLEKAGIFAPCYYYPAMPKGQAVIRINIMATHTQDQLDRFLESIGEADRL